MGDFYGNTFEGGSSGAGVVYKITPSGKLTVLTSFSGIGGAAVLWCRRAMATSMGQLRKAGQQCWSGLQDYAGRQAYRPADSLANGTTNGTAPFGGLALANDGNFYGVASKGR